MRRGTRWRIRLAPRSGPRCLLAVSSFKRRGAVPLLIPIYYADRSIFLNAIIAQNTARLQGAGGVRAAKPGAFASKGAKSGSAPACWPALRNRVRPYAFCPVYRGVRLYVKPQRLALRPDRVLEVLERVRGQLVDQILGRRGRYHLLDVRVPERVVAVDTTHVL